MPIELKQILFRGVYQVNSIELVETNNHPDIYMTNQFNSYSRNYKIIIIKLFYKIIYIMKYNCNIQGKMKDDLCVEDPNGEFEAKDLCEKTCFDRVLNNEISDWKKFFRELFTLGNINIYCKGGSTLGLVVLQHLLTKSPTPEIMREFVELKLIKDWDFTILLEPSQDPKQIITIAEKYNFKNEASLFPILRRRPNIQIAGEHLFELSIKNSENMSDLELPLTTLKFQITPDNLDNFFILTKYFLQAHEIELTAVLDILNTFDFNSSTVSVINGFFNIEGREIDDGGLSEDLFRILESMRGEIEAAGFNPNTFIQFLVAQFKEPDRLIVRFFGKNVPKSQKIKSLFDRHGVRLPPWLFDESQFDNINRLIEIFLSKINRYINDEFSYDLMKSCLDLMTYNIQQTYKDPSINGKAQAKAQAKSREKYKTEMNSYYNQLTNFFTNVNLGKMGKYISDAKSKPDPRLFSLLNYLVPNSKMKQLYVEIIRIKGVIEGNLNKEESEKKNFSISNVFILDKDNTKYSIFIKNFKPWEKTDEYKQKYLKYKTKYLMLKKMIHSHYKN